MQPSDGDRELFDATRSPCRKNVPSSCGRPNSCQPSVARVTGALHETVFLQAGYDPCHRWWPYLLRGGELAEGEGSAKDDYGESGKAGSRQPARVILLAQLAEEVNRG